MIRLRIKYFDRVHNYLEVMVRTLKLSTLQGCLAHKTLPPPRTLQ